MTSNTSNNMNAVSSRTADYRKDIPVLRAEIRALYASLDQMLGLSGASIPISFSFDDEQLGSYTPPAVDREEQFSFTLPFIAYSSRVQLSKPDREDLYRHEYAHYMRHNMTIPREYDFESGPHGSAWRYCCSLVDAVPSPYYKVGESLKKKDYDKALKNTWKDNGEAVKQKDISRRRTESRIAADTAVRFKAGDSVKHPKYGDGIVEEVSVGASGVRLTIDFNGEKKKIDQKWLIRAGLK